MKISKIDEIELTILEANRFIKKAVAWKMRIIHDELAGISGSKEGGAAKRASMDLSRSLADLRR